MKRIRRWMIYLGLRRRPLTRQERVALMERHLAEHRRLIASSDPSVYDDQQEHLEAHAEFMRDIEP